MKTLLLLFLLSFSIPSISQELPRKRSLLTGDFTVVHKQIKGSFDPSLNAYTLNSVTTNIKGASVGSGSLAMGTNPSINETITALIGKEIQGQLLFRIKNSGNLFNIDVHVVVNDKIRNSNNTYPVLLPHVSFEMPVRFISGNIQDFNSGKMITVQTTPEAANVFESNVSSSILTLVNNAFAGEFMGAPLKIEVESITLFKPVVMKIDSKNLSIDEMSTQYKLKAALGY